MSMTIVNRCQGTPIAFMDTTLFLSLAPCMDMYKPPLKKPRLTSAVIPDKSKAVATVPTRIPTLDSLPDECLYEILRRLTNKKHRGMASCVSRRWLMLLSTIPARDPDVSELPDLNLDPAADHDSTLIARCIEGRDATDARLAAVAIRDGSALGQLAIRSGSTACPVTGLGLKAVARCCPLLRAIMLWDVPCVGDDGLVEIAEGCSVLEKLDLCYCPSISDSSIVAIADNCPNLSILRLESCGKITNKGLQMLGKLCTKLESISIANCPLVTDEGLCSLISSSSSTLKKLKLQGLGITDVSLGVIGYYGKEITDLVLTGLPNVAERGFWVMGNTHGLEKLNTFKVTSCDGLTDLGVEAVAKGSPALKHISLRKAPGFSDAGLKSLARSAPAMEALVLEDCDSFTLPGIIVALGNGCRNLNSIAIARCAGVRDTNPLPCSACGSVRSVSVRNCRELGDAGVSELAKLFPNLQSLDVRSLAKLTDAGVVGLVAGLDAGLVKMKLSNCGNVTDASITALAKVHGSTIETLSVEGCRKVTDVGLMALVKGCTSLVNLDLSCSGVTDVGIAAFASTHKLKLKVLSIANCMKVSVKSLGVFGNMGRTFVGLNLQNCGLINSTAVAALQEKLWWCDILH